MSLTPLIYCPIGNFPHYLLLIPMSTFILGIGQTPHLRLIKMVLAQIVLIPRD